MHSEPTAHLQGYEDVPWSSPLGYSYCVELSIECGGEAIV